MIYNIDIDLTRFKLQRSDVVIICRDDIDDRLHVKCSETDAIRAVHREMDRAYKANYTTAAVIIVVVAVINSAFLLASVECNVDFSHNITNVLRSIHGTSIGDIPLDAQLAADNYDKWNFILIKLKEPMTYENFNPVLML